MIADGRMARRRRTGIATYINRLAEAEAAVARPPVRVQWVMGPPGLPRLNRLTSLANLALDLAWSHLALPLIAWLRGASALHIPMNWGPWWSPVPVVVTFQDLGWERRPDDFPPGFRRWARLFGRRSARTARETITTSESTAADLAELYGVPRSRINVIPIGTELPARFEPAGREPFILAVGEFEPRKRIPALVAGHRRYWEAAAGPDRCRLVLVGRGGSDEEAVRRAAGDGCELRGFVAADELDDLYRRATLLVFPSAFEGFGLPVIEAMARGCPVLLARNSSLREIGGDAAIWLDDASPDGIAAALGAALADREALAARGRRARTQAERFAWPATATRTLDVLARACA